jgi:transcription antitermination factor NusG
MAWWAVYSEPQREFLALKELAPVCAQAFLPYEQVTERRPGRGGRLGKPTVRANPLFQRYLFVRDAVGVEEVSKIRGVFGVLTTGEGFPLCVSVRDISRLFDACDEDGMISALDKTRLSLAFKGRLGNIFSFLGPLEGAQGEITSLDRLDTHGEVSAVVEFLGGRREISVPHQDVGAILGASASQGRRLAASAAR